MATSSSSSEHQWMDGEMCSRTAPSRSRPRSRPRPVSFGVSMMSRALGLGLVLGLWSGFRVRIRVYCGYCLIILIILQRLFSCGFASVRNIASCLLCQGQCGPRPRPRLEIFDPEVSSRLRIVLVVDPILRRDRQKTNGWCAYVSTRSV